MKKTTIKKYKSSKLKGASVLRISDVDYFLFKQLFNHRLLSSTQMYAYVHFFQKVLHKGKTPSKTTFLGRLQKLEEYNFLYRIVDKANRSSPHYFRLAPQGYKLLIERGFTTEEKADKINRFLIKRGSVVPGFHTHSISSVAILSECELYKNRITNFKSSKVSGEELTDMFEAFKVVPDWLFKIDRRYICLEIDTGTERGDTISEKAEKYIKLANNYKNIQFFVVFSVTDEVMEIMNIMDPKTESIERSARVRNLKKKMPAFTRWGNNLHFYASKSRRTPVLISKIASKEYQPINNKAVQNVGHWVSNLLRFKPPAFPLVPFTNKMDASNVYAKNVPYSQRSNLFLALTGDNVYRRNIVLLLAEEGSARTYQLMDFHQNLISIKAAGYTELHEAWLLYRTQEELEEDVTNKSWNDVWFNHLQGISNEVPLFYKQSGRDNKKELIKYY